MLGSVSDDFNSSEEPLHENLRKRQEEDRPVVVGLVGAGQMGTDIVSQIGEMPGITVPVVADVELENAVDSYRSRGLTDERIRRVSSASEAEDELDQDRVAVTENGFLIPRMDSVDVVIDATGVPEVGAELGFTAIQCRKHVVMMNVEADVVVGPILNRMASSAGVVYTAASGDEPATVMELYDFARDLNFEIVAAGKGKNNPLDPHVQPDKLKEKAMERGNSVTKLTSFVDGTNTMIEMTAVSNATGLVPDVQGMHGPDADIEELDSIFARKDEGGILNRHGVVDYTVGNLAPGVFLVFTTDNDRIRTSLEYNKMGSGPNYLLYRPYHLISLETVLSAARAEIWNRPSMVPKDELVSETVCRAKTDLEEGDVLDGIGGSRTYGTIVEASSVRDNNLLPMGLSDGATVTKSIERDQLIERSDVKTAEDSFILKLRSMQDRLTLQTAR